MYSKPWLLLKYLRYFVTASNGKGHGVHSPFVYSFIRNVLKEERRAGWFSRVEALRKKWRSDHSAIMVTDLGGKGSGNPRPELVSGLARRSLSTPKFGRFLFRVARYYRPQTMLELGTSLGLSGSYLLGGAGPEAHLLTIEGSEAIASLAQRTFTELRLDNAEIRTGDFADVLPAALHSGYTPELVFIDGNHRKEPLLRYVNALLEQEPRPRVIILHDIHWSREMEEGWRTICSFPELLMTIDLFSAGLIFFDEKFRIKQHFQIRF